MEELNVKRLEKALSLKRNIVGVHFLAYKMEYDESPVAPSEKRGSFCSFVNRASRGEHFKINAQHFTCQGGASSIGVTEETEDRRTGRLYQHCGLYSSHAIARLVNSSMNHIPHKIYGVEIGPLSAVESADVVIIIATAKQCMRLIQGYTYEYGPATHLSTVGNQAACSDLCAKPFVNNDLNISFMCCGMRMCTQADDGEMGVGLPIQMFSKVTNGVLQTLNLTEQNKYILSLSAELEDPDELGIELRLDEGYGKNAQKYEDEARKMAEAEEAYFAGLESSSN